MTPEQRKKLVEVMAKAVEPWAWMDPPTLLGANMQAAAIRRQRDAMVAIEQAGYEIRLRPKSHLEVEWPEEENE